VTPLRVSGLIICVFYVLLYPLDEGGLDGVAILTQRFEKWFVLC
jgi:hypothetical protein